jgi:hypothetical protein
VFELLKSRAFGADLEWLMRFPRQFFGQLFAAAFGLLALPALGVDWQSIAGSDVRFRNLSPDVSSFAQPSAPAHYVVFEIDQMLRVEPVFYQSVMLPAEFSVSSFGDQREASRIPGMDRVQVATLDGDMVQETAVVNVPQYIRGEFARDAERGDFNIEAVQVRAEMRSFTVRVSQDVSLLEVRPAGLPASIASQRFDLREVAARAGKLKHHALAQLDGDDTRGSTTDSANRVDLLVVAEGYTAAEQGKFNTDAQALLGEFFAPEPFGHYRNFVNWRPRFFASNQSGADHPPFQAGCTAITCCADAAAQSDPRAGTFVDTAFDARFCASNVHRLLVINASKVQAAAANVPAWDKIVVLVNDPVYGGSGGNFAVGSTNTSAAQVMVHEYGHSFTRLADEYSSAFPGFPACSDIAGSPCEANVTDQSNANLVKWRARFSSGIQIPTPNGSAGLGLFQGARYLNSGMYRPVDNCLMRSLNRPFCDVCREAYVQMLYTGGFGVPTTGVSVIEPNSELPPTSTAYIYFAGHTQSFSISPLNPVGGNLRIQWYLQDQPIAGATGAGISLNFPSPQSIVQIRVEVFDASPYLNATQQTATRRTRNWLLQIQPNEILRNGFE